MTISLGASGLLLARTQTEPSVAELVVLQIVLLPVLALQLQRVTGVLQIGAYIQRYIESTHELLQYHTKLGLYRRTQGATGWRFAVLLASPMYRRCQIKQPTTAGRGALTS